MASPLNLMMPVLPQTKLAALIEMLEKANATPALTSIGTVHYARFLLLDRSKPNLLPDLAEMNTPSDTLIIGVVTEYDGSFEAYISDFTAQLGDVFDAMLSHVIGGADVMPVKDNLNAFTKFVAENDGGKHQPNQGLFNAYPQTVQQVLAAVS